MQGIEWITEGIGVFEEFLSPAICQKLIERGEALGYEQATVITENGVQRIEGVRNNDRVILDDAHLAQDLWTRLKPHIPGNVGTVWRALGLNERFRFYRYARGQQFDWHLDGSFVRSQRDRSIFTFMIYLNDDCEGGETLFAPDAESRSVMHSIKPKIGMALIFRHLLNHKGNVVDHGVKYVLRSDVMYTDSHPES